MHNARILCNQACAIACEPGQLARSEHYLAKLQLRRGRLGQAEVHLKNALQAARATGKPPFIHAVLQTSLHHACLFRRDRDECATQASQILAFRSAHQLEHTPLGALANWYLLCDDQTAVRDTLENDIMRHRRNGDRVREALGLLNLGFLELQQDHPDAKHHVQQALTLSRRTGDRATECLAWQNLGDLSLCEHDLTHAQVAFLAARELATELDSARLNGLATYGLAKIAMAKRNADTVTRVTEAIEWTTLSSDAVTKSLAKMLLAPALYDQGQGERAAAAWQEAMQFIEEEEPPLHMISVDHHLALFDFCRGATEAARTLLATQTPTVATRMLAAMIHRRE